MAPRKYNKRFNIMLNILVPLFAILILLQACVFLINGLFGDSTERSLEISADIITSMEKKPLYDIFEYKEKEEDRAVIDEIKTKTDFVKVYKNYINGLIEKGDFTFYSYGLTSGSGSYAGVSGTAYYAFEETTRVSKDGTITIEFASAEIPDGNGKLQKMYANEYIFTTIKDGIGTEKSNASTTYSVENGKYVLHYDSSYFTKEESEKIEYKTLFALLIDEDTITNINIDKRAFSYIIDISLNKQGYMNTYSKVRKEASKDFDYEYFNLSFTVSIYGDIISFTRSEKCLLNPSGYPASSILTLAKNCYYILKKEK